MSTALPLPPTGGQHAAVVLEKLQERQEARKAEREQRQQASEQASDPREDVKKFLSKFSSDHKCLQEQLQQQAAAAAAGSGMPREELLRQLEQAACEISKLEQTTADAAYFLPSYELRSSTAALQELRSQVTAIKQQLQPKKKFAFSKAVTRTSTAVAAAPAPAFAQQQQQPDGDVQEAADGSARDQASSSSHQASTTTAPTSQQQELPAVSAPPPSAHDLQLITSGLGCTGLRGGVVFKTAEQLSGQSFVLHDLVDCTVFLLGSMSALRLQQLVSCTVVTGPVSGATFISAARNCTFMIASHQVRIHEAQQCDFYLHVRSRPIIEHSSGLRFAPYAVDTLLSLQQQQQQQQQEQQQQEQEQQDMQSRSRDLAELFAAAQLVNDSNSSNSSNGASSSMWQQVDDFGWVKASQSPNWCVLPEQQRQAPPHPPAPLIISSSTQ